MDLVIKQAQAPPFNMVQVIPRFAAILRDYHVSSVTGDSVGGDTYRDEWLKAGVQYRVSKDTTSELYEALEPVLNGHRVTLPDVPALEQQLLGLVWRGGKITHPSGQHDDFATSAAGVVSLLATAGRRFPPLVGSVTVTSAEKAEAFWQRRQTPAPPSRSQAEDNRVHLIRCQDPRSCGHHPAHDRTPAAPKPAAPPQVVDDARGIHRVSTPTGGRETYVDPRGLEVERPFVRACCLAPGTCQRQPFEPVPGPSFFDAQFQQHWERRHAGQSMPP